jgi:hypothetical protein
MSQNPGSIPLAPTFKKRDVKGWLLSSIAIGLPLSFLVLFFLWRPLLGLAAPPCSLSFHFLGLLDTIGSKLLPHWLGASAEAYQASLHSLSPSERLALMWRLLVATAFGLIPSVLLAKSYLSPKDDLLYLRGARRYEGKHAVERLKGVLRRMSAGKAMDHQIAPEIAYTRDLWTRHAFLVGGTGAGKSSVIKPLVEQIIRADEKLILFDPKGDFTEIFPSPVLLAPWDSRSFAWDVARDMRNFEDMKRFAAGVIPASTDPMWSNAAKALLSESMLVLSMLHGQRWSWEELADFLRQPQAALCETLRLHGCGSYRLIEKPSVTSQGIMINLIAYCSPIEALAVAWADVPVDRRISFLDWALNSNQKHRQIILQGHGAYPDLTKSYAAGIFEVISGIVSSIEMPDDHKGKLWLVFDELPLAGKLSIQKLFALGRSRGLCCVAACQDFAQLEEVYGALPVKAMLSLCGTVIVGKIKQGETAEALCKALGTAEHERPNTSQSISANGSSSVTHSYSRHEAALYKPSELSSRLGFNRRQGTVTLALMLDGDAYELAWPVESYAVLRLRHEPAPWTTTPMIRNHESAYEADDDGQAEADESIKYLLDLEDDA